MAARKKRKKTKPKTRILVVDDHPIMRAGIARLINQESDLVVCSEAADASEALKAISSSDEKPDLVIVDISLAESNGLNLVKDIKIWFGDLPILVLSMHDETLYADRALRAGARGYVMKSEASEEIITAIRKILSGEIHVSDRMSAKMLKSFAEGRTDLNGSPVDCLTDRELEVFRLIGQGLVMRQIAERLCVSIRTVEAHRAHIRKKLNLRSATDLMQFAIRWMHGESMS